MILQYESTAPEYNGRIGGDIYRRQANRGVARTRSRPANARQRTRWNPPWLFTPARNAWDGLDSLARESWETAADTLSAWPIQGSPRNTTAQLFFENYYTVLLLLDAGAAVPAAPPSGPLWQTLPQWFEFAEWISDRYTLKAETEFEEGTQILFSGLPPSPSVFNGEWFGEQIIGNNTFTDGLEPDELWDGIHDMIETTFGPINDTMKIWGRVWEVYPATGFIRVLKDPCTPDPPEAVGNTLNVILYNDYNEVLDSALFNILDNSEPFPEAIGFGEFEGLIFLETDEITITLYEGYTTDDIQNIHYTIDWADGFHDEQEIVWDGNDPLEISSNPS